MLKKDQRILIFIALFIYRIPLSRIIGDNGLGFLTGPMEMYVCALLLFGTGLTTVLSGMMKERLRKGQYRNASQVFIIARRYTFIIAVILLALNVLGFEFISTKILCDAGQRLAYLCVGPALFLGMFIQLNIGYLIGTDNIRAVVIAEIIEAILLGFGVIIGGIVGVKYGTKIAAILINEDVTAMYGALGVMLGVCFAELFSLVVFVSMTMLYQKSFRHMMRSDDTRRTDYVSDIIHTLSAGIVSDGFLSLFIQLPVIVLITMYRRHGVQAEVADTGAMIGAFYGKVLSITGIVSAISILPIGYGVKGVQAAASEGDSQLAGERISRMFARLMYFAIPSVIFITMLVPVIFNTFFVGRNTTAENTLTVGCSLIIIYAVLYLFEAILLRTGFHVEVLFVNAISFVISSVLGFILVQKGSMAFKGVILLLMADYGIGIIICLILLLRSYRLRFRYVQQIVLPIVIAGILGVVLKLLSGALLNVIIAPVVLCICLIIAWFAYNMICMFLRVVSAGAMDRKLFGHILVRIGQNMGIY